jgi:transposase
MPAVLQRGPNLPSTSSAWSRVCWPLDGPCREVTLLSDYRRDLVKQRTRVVNRLRWHLHELDPPCRSRPGGLRRYRVPDARTERP